MTPQDIQNSIDIIQREATKINSAGLDVSGTFDNMRDVSRANMMKAHNLHDIIIEAMPDAVIEDINDTLYVSPKQNIYGSEA